MAAGGQSGSSSSAARRGGLPAILPARLVRAIPAALLLTAAFGRPLSAQDKLYLKRPDSTETLMTAGEILDYTGRTIRYRTQTGLREEPASIVVRVETTYPEADRRAQQAFEAGDYAAAIDEWRAALRTESRAWVQRELRARIVRTLLREGRFTDAGEAFLEIVASDPETLHWPVAPLLWAPTPLSVDDRAAASSRMSSTVPAARLLGASVLLGDANLGDAAERALQDLARDVSANISQLARAQLWRRRSGTAISDNELANWRSHVASMPPGTRAGPQYLIGRARLARSEFDIAAAELLWVPLVYSEHEPTAARASFDAAEALLRAGHRDDADRLFAETAERYPWSPVAREAESRRRELAAPAP
ncbi:MAG: hypothetical protein KF774_03875 [Planctomyces sp.]|nr:hypothetical protein [Planctomyces sp.]